MGYLRRLRRELARQAHRLEHGRVYIVDVHHDEWCPRLQGSAACLCDAEIGPPRLVARPKELGQV